MGTPEKKSRNKKILSLYKRGYSAKRIKEKLKLDITRERVRRIILTKINN